MSYRVLARTYRSNTFDEVVGQSSIATTLKNAILSQRVHHGYLFTGTRGVGKTSMARILAKALNCLATDAPSPTPCCECESCLAVASGEDVDVVEIDAASNTGVDDMRMLRSNAALRPARARFKIYIIDEVHMLSTNAFNALLKTLEEPPSHVKFILATTEAQKVPATVQSRCQRFDFHAIDTDAIAMHLGDILKREKVETDDGVMRRIARLANGSMRDALSLLDMVLSYESTRLSTEILDELIPPPHDELAFAVMDGVAQSDPAGALSAVDRALQTGRTVERFCTHLIEHVRTLMLLNVCGSDTDLVDVSGPMRPALAEQAANFDAPTYVYMIALLEELRRNVKSASASRALADAAVVRLAMSRQFTDLTELIERLDEGSGGALPQPAPSRAKKKDPAESSALAQRGDVVTSTSKPHRQVAPKGNNTSAALAPRSAAVSSEQMDRVAGDPLVQRVKDAVDGTLTDIRLATTQPTPRQSGADDEAQDETSTTE